MGAVDKVGDFYVGTNKAWKIRIEFLGEYPNITADVVTWTIKKAKGDSDDNAILVKEADVTTQGADAWALFSIDKTEALTNGRFVMDVQWKRSDEKEYVVWEQQIEIKERVSDV